MCCIAGCGDAMHKPERENNISEVPLATHKDNRKIPLNPTLEYKPYTRKPTDIVISRQAYFNRLYGFWLGQCIANWTGLVTEMDKIGGAGPHGKFYTRESWGQPDQPTDSIFTERAVIFTVMALIGFQKWRSVVFS